MTDTSFCRVCGRRDGDYARPESGYWDDPWCAACGRGPVAYSVRYAYNGRRYRGQTAIRSVWASREKIYRTEQSMAEAQDRLSPEAREFIREYLLPEDYPVQIAEHVINESGLALSRGPSVELWTATEKEEHRREDHLSFRERDERVQVLRVKELAVAITDALRSAGYLT